MSVEGVTYVSVIEIAIVVDPMGQQSVILLLSDPKIAVRMTATDAHKWAAKLHSNADLSIDLSARISQSPPS